MSLDLILVNAVGLALIALIAWFFWGKPRTGMKAAAASGEIQEISIAVKGGYTPDVIVAKLGRPIRLRFTRRESSACSEKVVFPDLGLAADLPEGVEVVIDAKPDKAGVYDFRCGMGMLRGKLIVE